MARFHQYAIPIKLSPTQERLVIRQVKTDVVQKEQVSTNSDSYLQRCANVWNHHQILSFFNFHGCYLYLTLQII